MSLTGGLLIAAAPVAAFLLLLAALRWSKRISPQDQWRLTLSLHGFVAAGQASLALSLAWTAKSSTNWFVIVGALCFALGAVSMGLRFFKTLRAGPPAPLGAEIHA